MRNRREHTNPWQEAPNLFRQELSPQTPSRYVERGILRNVPLVHSPQTMLLNREASGVKTQSRNDQDRPIAVLAGLIADRDLSHLASLPVTLWSHGIMGSLDGFPTKKDYQDILVVLLFSPMEAPF